MGIIYIATSKTTGKSYVGKTEKSLKERSGRHRITSRSPSSISSHRFGPLHEDIARLGWDDFEWQVLCESDRPEVLAEMETRMIKALGTQVPNGYNRSCGTGCKGMEIPIHIRQLWSTQRKGVRLSADRIAKSQSGTVRMGPRKKTGRTSQYKGVSKHTQVPGLWCVSLRVSKKLVLCKSFRSELDAAHAYDEAVRKFVGPHGYVNFPKEL